MPRCLRARRAYTLTELLLVVSMIALLIGMLLPAVQRCRASAAKAHCTNNLRQRIIACHNYESTHGRFPSVSPTPNEWAHVTSVYMEGPERRVMPQQCIARRFPAMPYAAGDTKQPGFTGARIADFTATSATLAIAERWWAKYGPLVNVLPDQWAHACTTTVLPLRDGTGAGHTAFGSPHDTLPAAFADGHVAQVSFDIHVSVWRSYGRR